METSKEYGADNEGIPNVAFQPDEPENKSTTNRTNKDQPRTTTGCGKYNYKQFLPCAPR